jgi:hypothetical protein
MTKPQFWFSGFNHSMGGRETLHDISFCIAGQLRDLGYSCGRDPGNDAQTGTVALPPFVNILFEGFHPGIINEVRRTKKDKARFICIMTEQPGKRGFNDMKGDYAIRQVFFREAAKEMDAIWCLVPGSAQWAKQFNPNSVDMETGFSTMRRDILRGFANAEPIYDVCFFGGLTQRRQNILNAIKARGLSVWTPEDLPIVDDTRLTVPGMHGATKKSDMYASIEHRNATIALCRCVVELKPNPKREYPSSTRLNVALHVGRPCIVEKHPIDSIWKKVVPFASSYEEFFELVKHVCDNWRVEYADQMDHFQRVLSPANCVGKALEDTHVLEWMADWQSASGVPIVFEEIGRAQA